MDLWNEKKKKKQKTTSSNSVVNWATLRPLRSMLHLPLASSIICNLLKGKIIIIN